MNFWHFFDTLQKSPDIKVGGDSLDIVIDMWREDDLEILCGMKFQVKGEYGKDKFVKFYVEADVVDGVVLNYPFSSLVEDIRRTCGSLRHHTSSTLRIRYKDEDGDFVNLRPSLYVAFNSDEFNSN